MSTLTTQEFFEIFSLDTGIAPILDMSDYIKRLEAIDIRKTHAKIIIEAVSAIAYDKTLQNSSEERYNALEIQLMALGFIEPQEKILKEKDILVAKISAAFFNSAHQAVSGKEGMAKARNTLLEEGFDEDQVYWAVESFSRATAYQAPMSNALDIEYQSLRQSGMNKAEALQKLNYANTHPEQIIQESFQGQHIENLQSILKQTPDFFDIK